LQKATEDAAAELDRPIIGTLGRDVGVGSEVAVALSGRREES